MWKYEAVSLYKRRKPLTHIKTYVTCSDSDNVRGHFCHLKLCDPLPQSLTAPPEKRAVRSLQTSMAGCKPVPKAGLDRLQNTEGELGTEYGLRQTKEEGAL
jgi:hypothetical protein